MFHFNFQWLSRACLKRNGDNVIIFLLSTSTSPSKTDITTTTNNNNDTSVKPVEITMVQHTLPTPTCTPSHALRVPYLPYYTLFNQNPHYFPSQYTIISNTHLAQSHTNAVSYFHIHTVSYSPPSTLTGLMRRRRQGRHASRKSLSIPYHRWMVAGRASSVDVRGEIPPRYWPIVSSQPFQRRNRWMLLSNHFPLAQGATHTRISR